MAGKGYKPPVLDDDSVYVDWLKELEVWEELTDLPDEKKALAVFAALQGKTKKAALQMEIKELKDKNGIKKITTKLSALFLKDIKHATYDAYEKFEKFQRDKNMSIQEYTIEFEDLHYNLSKYKIVLPEAVLVYRYLNSANLSEHHKEMVRATIADLTYSNMVQQVKAIYHDAYHKSENDSAPVKVEKCEDDEDPHNTYYGTAAHQWNRGRGRDVYRGNNRFDNNRRNPTNRNGESMRCHKCGSIYHFARFCTEKNSRTRDEIKLQFYTEEVMHTLVGETICMAVLDSGCTKTVCGEKWLSLYLETLDETDRGSVKFEPSTTSFKFGDGMEIKAKRRAIIPAYLSDQRVQISTEIVDKDLPLLFSKEAMKNTRVFIDFENDRIQILGKDNTISYSSTGHYCIPLNKTQIETGKTTKLCFLGSVLHLAKDKKKVAEKLHRQFGHANPIKLKELIKNANIQDDELVRMIDKVSTECEICIKYNRNNARPCVGFPLATRFNECVAMDLKQWSFKDKVWLIHIIDHLTRFSASCVIYSKKKEVIIDAVFKIWISVFGPAKKFLVDNGGEFANANFISMCENLNMSILTTAAESPWSNGLVERHNGVLGNIVSKMMTEKSRSYTLETAVAWAISAKNSLKNVHGFSPNQLVFGCNPNYPNIETDSPPALEGKTSSEVVAYNLNAMHAARKAFIESESCERLRRAMKHNVRSSGEVKFINGDIVYYRRNSDGCWKGPGRVIGQENKQILVKHGSTYIRMHPCRLKLKTENETTTEVEVEIEKEGVTENVNSSLDDDEIEEIYRPSTAGRTNEVNVDNEEENAVLTEPVDGNTRQSTSRDQKICLPKINDHIRYRTNEDWQTGQIHSRAGKTSGKYANWLNIVTDGEMKNLNWEDVKEWQKVDDIEEVLLTENATDQSRIKIAKEEELQNWKDNDVFEEVSYCNKKAITTRWVISQKVTDSGERKIKARLVARGFEDTDVTDKDSPTCSREALRIIFVIISSNSWECNSIDVKAAFLQGKYIERDVYLIPPKEFRKDKDERWKLKKTVYGLPDASRTWYARLKEELNKLGAKVSKFDLGLFYYHKDDVLQGVMCIHVDDICWGGSQVFITNIIKPLYNMFKIGTSHTRCFKYLGLELKTMPNAVTVSQLEYIKGIEMMKIDKKIKTDPLNEDEKKELRMLIGQLNWVASQTRPDILFQCCELLTRIKNATVEDIKNVNKMILKLKTDNVLLSFRNLGMVDSAQIIAFHDASLANLNCGGSQGAFVIFLSDSLNKNVSAISWQSRKLKRVVNSTLAAEALQLIEAAGKSFWLKSILQEIYKGSEFPVTCLTDSKTLFQATKSTKQILDKRLAVDLAMIKEKCHTREVHQIEWIPKEKQLADCMTKKGANSDTLLNVLTSGRLDL